MARASGIMADPAFQDRLAAASINVTALAALFSHAVELTNQKQSPGPESSIIKIFGSELLQALNELLIEAAGGHAPMEKPIITDFGEVDVSTPFLQARRATIYGGSSEIQRNVGHVVHVIGEKEHRVSARAEELGLLRLAAELEVDGVGRLHRVRERRRQGPRSLNF